ncbi:major intrinsically disordered NOTCH2-binding receptor 1-like isoform X3 [Camelus bactrianus]|uniref:Major intrinsically disordered NOTCH2-binding receptor 1-like isoform X3 n=1 Tax=Camelus bactrianus TaxID=9837 RepID=A0A9W3HA82_CAMBA|nr:major intrinsically disordered NOTCH2-binding receptor 1-like isoform X3 [Camelus dromedarius]XP_045363823.1 major intrinsically disordered NOTCH2-binding receptor 1-like isoform X3 [Camelus bactrianus]
MHGADRPSLTCFCFLLQMKGDMDLSVLPNNNHPDKFLQLDVKSLMRSSAPGQAGLVRFPGGNYPPAAQHWRNLIYSQREKKNITAQRTRGSHSRGAVATEGPPPSLSSVLKNNPLYDDENPNDLRFWLGDMYTPGFDTLLKKEEEQEKHSRCCRVALILLLVACILVSIVTVSAFFT